MDPEQQVRRLTGLLRAQARLVGALDAELVLATARAALDELVDAPSATEYLEASSPVDAPPPVGQALGQGRLATCTDSAGALYLAAPLCHAGQAYGVLRLRLPGPDLSPELGRAVELFATATAAALHTARLYRETEQAAHTDALTGLLNRRAFDTQLELELRRARRLGYPVGLLMMDVDEFKRVNDRYGHLVGDETLRRVAAVLAGGLRRTDVVARVGGEEFAAILPGTSLAEVGAVAEKLRVGVGTLEWPPGDPRVAGGARDWPRPTLSFGGASLPAARATADALLTQADAALYRAKRRGRDQVQLWDEAG
jgi:diguanylate cyclase (GGDEF)-like protein